MQTIHFSEKEFRKAHSRSESMSALAKAMSISMVTAYKYCRVFDLPFIGGHRRSRQRALKIFKALCKGKSVAQVARDLNIAPSTVQYWKQEIYVKA